MNKGLFRYRWLIGSCMALAMILGAMVGFSKITEAASAYDFGSVTLRQGSVGAQVINVQGTLRWPSCGGYDLVPSGVFDANTAAAVRSFQASRGLMSDGIVGPNTRVALAACLNQEIAITAARYAH